MNKEWWIGCCIIFLLGLAGIYYPFDQTPSLSPELAERLGYQIWKNECAGKKEGLTAWNKGEDFPSLGIGHFIWFPEGKPQNFKQTFPELLLFFRSHGVQLPLWLEQANGSPWRTREDFEAAQNQKPLQELRDLLAKHVDLQILFMVKRLNKALPTLLKHAPAEEHSHLIFQFYRLAQTPGGLYALLDYLNFKGEGTAAQESYQGRRWGLLQVLEDMHGSAIGQPAVEEFVEAAKKVLTLRVEHSPPGRGESRWLKGWHNRLDSYRTFSQD